MHCWLKSLTAPALTNNDAERKGADHDCRIVGRRLRQRQILQEAGGWKREVPLLAILAASWPSSNNTDELLDAWVGWHKISPPMRKKYARFVELSNKGARELGFKRYRGHVAGQL